MGAELLPCISFWAADRSWRVRWSLAQHLHLLVRNVSSSNVGATGVINSVIDSLVSAYDSLLRDSEAEVRAAALSHCQALIQSIFSPSRSPFSNSAHGSYSPHSLLLSVQRLCSDSSDFVRVCAASAICSLCSVVSKDDLATQALPSLLQLLRDERSEVRLAVVTEVELLHKAVGIETLAQALLPALSELSMYMPYVYLVDYSLYRNYCRSG
jgi:serine/threonine-protein phosphatase 2A regulatory subunit A